MKPASISLVTRTQKLQVENHKSKVLMMQFHSWRNLKCLCDQQLWLLNKEHAEDAFLKTISTLKLHLTTVTFKNENDIFDF